MRKKQTGTHDLDPDKQNVSDASGVLHLHKTYLKKENHVNNYEFEEIAGMLDDETEPDMHHPLKHAYWNIRQNFDRYLRREMFIGDDTDTVFELNLSTKKTDWPGTMTLIGSSGAGKTRFLTDLMLRYLRGTADHSKRQILWLSPELEIDKTILPLKAERWAMWFRGVDISSQAVKKSGLGAAAYYQQHVADLIESSGEDALIVLDDFPDGAPGLPDAPGGLQQLDPGRAAPEPGHIQPAAHVRGRAQHEPEPAVEQVHRLLPPEPAEPVHHVHAGPPDDADRAGAGAGAALRQARPVDVYPDAQLSLIHI